MSHHSLGGVEMEDRSLTSAHLLDSPNDSNSERLVDAPLNDESDRMVPPHGSSSSRRPANNNNNNHNGGGGQMNRSQSDMETEERHKRRCQIVFGVLVGIVLLIILIIVIKERVSSSSSGTDNNQAVSSKYASLVECLTSNRIPNLSVKGGAGHRPPPPPSTPQAVMFRHASIWSATGELLENADLYIANGTIAAVSTQSNQALPDPSPVPDGGFITIDAKYRYITPGLFDIHSHAGVGAYPNDLWATDDVNEMTKPAVPMMRAVDALDPRDPAFPLILAGGVVTSQIMPGSGTTMGGNGIIVKNRGRTIDDMIVPNAPPLKKMACGENPKRVFGRSKGVMPMSRMGNAWIMREQFEKAQQLKQKQDDWCTNTADYQSANRFPTSREHESLASLLRGEIHLNVHCYLTQDFEMMLRLSTEFNFTISAFHHALSAWRIPDILAYNNISVATFSDLGLYKYEAYDASVWNAKILNAAGVNTIIKSDHPVLFSGGLMYEAAKAHAYGLPASAAIAAVTSAPARAAGISDHIGSLKLGYDADVVVWDRDPLTIGARASSVYVNGVKLVDIGDTPKQRPSSLEVVPDMTADGPKQVCGLYNDSKLIENDVYRTVDLECFSIVDVDIYTPLFVHGNMIIQNGLITCIGASTACPLPTEADCQTMKIAGGKGVLIPGMIEAGTHVGQFDISSEDVTGDGTLSEGAGTSGDYGIISTRDGIRYGSRHVRSAWASGITTTIARPMGSQLISGQSSAFRTCCGATMAGISDTDPVFVADNIGLHVTVGNAAKNGGSAAAISGQMSVLRGFFERANVAVTNASLLPRTDVLAPFVNVLHGVLPLMAEVYHADEILAVVRLQKDFGFKLVLIGAAEVGLIANVLATTTPKVSVLYFSRPNPNSFETLRVQSNTLRLLQDAGVPYALSTGDTDNARNLRWEGGWNQDTSELTMQQTVEAVTNSVARIFNLPPSSGTLRVGDRAEFVLFNGSPFSLQSTVQLVGTGVHVDCRPKQR